MKIYAYTYPGGSGMTKDYKEIAWKLRIQPYFKYRVFYDMEVAQEFIRRYTMKKELKSLNCYGTVFTDKVISVTYFIYANTIFINYDKHKLPELVFEINNNECAVNQLADTVSLRIDNIQVNNQSIIAHMIAIIYILRFAGEFVDLNIALPDRSIYYALFAYTGDNEIINRAQHAMKERLGGLAVTVENW